MFKINFDLFRKLIIKLFPFYKNKELKFVFKKLQLGFAKEIVTARFVGGCVRKFLNNEKIDDIDIATILSTDEVKERFKDSKFKIIDSGLEHGTITLLSKKIKLEITTLRKDIKTDGRHALVEFTDDWYKDSERRDFTINSIYLDINGKIFDPQSGVNDLKNKNVKFIGDPQKRIEEDYLRIIRFIRFKFQYDSKVEKSTLDAIKLNLNGIQKISKERILVELFKILKLKNFLKINENNELKELFSNIFPELINLNNIKRLDKILNYTDLNLETLLSILLIDGKDNHEYFAHKYNISNKTRENLKLLATNYKQLNENKFFFKKELLKNLYYHGTKHLIALNILNFVFNSKMQVENFLTILKNIHKSKIPELTINGEYLIKRGMKEGSTLGKVLKLIEQEWLNNDFKISEGRVLELIKNNNN